MAVIDSLVGDLEKEIQEMEFEEKDAQEDYEKFIEDSANKHATDSKSLTDKEAAKADAEAFDKRALNSKSLTWMANEGR